MLVALGQDRYAKAFDEATGTQIVQGLNVRVAPGTLPGTHHLTVLADIITIEGAALSFPGQDLTLVARIIRGNATISTKGESGTPSFAGETQPIPGQPGRDDTGIGQKGGSVTIVATSIEGKLSIDTGGGKGGDAQNGAKGVQGIPGVPGSYQVPPTASGNGGQGGKAGVPGRGGAAGNVVVMCESELPAIAAVAIGGEKGAAGRHGDPGDPGPPAPAVSGYEIDFVFEGPV